MQRCSQIIQNASLIFWVTLMLSGCASVASKTSSEKRFDIVVVASDHAHSERIIMTPNESGLQISGEVHKKFHGPGTIRGHVDIELVAKMVLY